MTSQPWDRRLGESTRAHAAFLAYRDAGPARSLDAVAREWAGSGSRSRIGTWSSSWSWVARAARWDEHVYAVEDAAFVEETRARVRREAELGAVLVDLALDAARLVDPADLDPRDVVRVAAEGVRVERLARSLPDRHTDPAPYALAVAGTDAEGNPYAAAAAGMTDEERRDRLAAVAREVNRRLAEHAEADGRALETRGDALPWS
ncbi:hypothetical protein [Cellulomonas sp.]|uniref:hypothetical protein n=1 Tax=Cellulomonas sp. TaxID=40001 RepID=UPI003BAC4043